MSPDALTAPAITMTDWQVRLTALGERPEALVFVMAGVFELACERIEGWLDELDNPLLQELASAPLTRGAMQRLCEIDVPLAFVGALNARGRIGAAGVSLSRDGGRYDPHGPTARLLVAVEEEGEVIDVAALASHDPDQWALRTGMGWCLGHMHWCEAQRAGIEGRAATLRLFSTPIDWLRGHGQGICVLDWNAAALSHLRALGEGVLLRVDAGAGERLRALMAHGGLPRVKERAPVRARQMETV